MSTIGPLWTAIMEIHGATGFECLQSGINSQPNVWAESLPCLLWGIELVCG